MEELIQKISTMTSPGSYGPDGNYAENARWDVHSLLGMAASPVLVGDTLLLNLD